MNNSRILTTKNAKFSGYYFNVNLNIWGDFQFCTSVPLRQELVLFILLFSLPNRARYSSANTFFSADLRQLSWHKSYSYYSPWYRDQIGISLRTKPVIYQKLAYFMQRKDIYVNRLGSVYLQYVNMYFTDQNEVEREDHKKSNFEGLEMQK